MRGRLNHPVSGYHLVVHLIVCISLTGAALFVALSVNRNSDQKFCNVIFTQLRQAERQAEGLDRNPPSTPAGESLRTEWRDSATSFARLAKDLGCQEARP